MKTLACVCAIAILLVSGATGADARVIAGDLDNSVAIYYFDPDWVTDSGAVRDFSSNGLHGDLSKDAELKTVSGRKCLSLGSRDALFQAVDDNKPLFVNKEFSIVAWVKIPQQTNDFRIEILSYNGSLAGDVYAGSEGWIQLGVFSSGDLFGSYVYTFNLGGSAAAALQSTGKKINNNRWHHVGFVVNRTSTRLYLNGNQIAKESFSGHPSFGGAGSLVFIGYDAKGSVDDVGFFNDAFSDSHVKLIYNYGLGTIVNMASVDPSGKVATMWGALKKR